MHEWFWFVAIADWSTGVRSSGANPAGLSWAYGADGAKRATVKENRPAKVGIGSGGECGRIETDLAAEVANHLFVRPLALSSRRRIAERLCNEGSSNQVIGIEPQGTRSASHQSSDLLESSHLVLGYLGASHFRREVCDAHL
jgi:hypothetical protein